jgi:hypothetical protein
MTPFPRYLLLLGLTLAAITILLTAGGRVPFPAQAGPDFSGKVAQTHINGIAEQRPELILLGDSIVEENVDTPALSGLLGRKVYTMSFGGSASALWYLALKNNILAAPYPPAQLVIVFRDTILTAPGYRVQGKFSTALDNLATPEDTLAVQLAYLNRMNPLEKFAERYFPLYDFGLTVHAVADMHIYLLPRLLLRCGNRCVDTALLNVFNFRNAALPKSDSAVDAEENLLYARAALDFNRRVGDSFLPQIIRLCRENNIQLIFVRAKTFRFSSPSAEPPALREYLRALEDYLMQNGVLYVDINADPRVTREDYLDRFHVMPEARGRYTQMLADGLLTVLP